MMHICGDFLHVLLFGFFFCKIFLFASQVVLLGMDILSALVSRLQERFRTQVGTGELLRFVFKVKFK